MKKILVVEDDFLVRVGICSMCDWESHGYSLVGQAENGREALRLIETANPDIVLTDLVMSVMDGFELIAECKKRWPHIALIVLSNYDDFNNVKKAMKLGAVDYIQKISVNSQSLLEVLDGIDISGCGKDDAQDSNTALLRFQVLRRLMAESGEMSADMEAQCHSVGLDFDFSIPLRIMEFRLRSGSRMHELISLGDMINGAMPPDVKGTVCLDGESRAVVFISGEFSVEDAHVTFDRVKAECLSELSRNIAAGISDCASDILSLKEALRWVDSAFLSYDAESGELLHSGRSQRGGIRKAVEYINDNLEKNLTLDVLADIASMSECYFSHIFKEEKSVGVKEYITLKRIERAKMLLSETNEKIAYIAKVCGFPNANYFSSVFKKVQGNTPIEYRNASSEGVSG